MNEHDEQLSERERQLPEHELREKRGTAEGGLAEQPPEWQPGEEEPAVDPDQESPVAYKPRSG